MKYKIQKLDGRYSHREYFKYYVVFRKTSSFDCDHIINFNNTIQWFTKTYGSSTEIRMWKEILRYHNRFGAMLDSQPLPNYVNFNWSWTNGYEDLRIYVKGDKELALFKLAYLESQ